MEMVTWPAKWQRKRSLLKWATAASGAVFCPAIGSRWELSAADSVASTLKPELDSFIERFMLSSDLIWVHVVRKRQ